MVIREARALRISPLHRARQASVGLVIAGLHLMGLLAWWSMGSAMRAYPSPVGAPSIAVWLPALPTLSTEVAKRLKPEPSHHPDRVRRGDTAEPSRAAGLALPAANSVVTASPAESTLVEAQTPSAPGLDLTLSRQALAPLVAPSFADRSPFHGRLPTTVERQIAAAAAESGPWTEERIDNDHVRLRRGTTCVMMERPQAAIIDPFSDAARRMPWRASVSKC
jgi:hypothetical protein